MKATANIMLVITVLAAVGVLAVSIYPGVLADLVFFALITSCLWAPLLLLAGLAVVIALAMGKITVKRNALRRFAAAAVLLFLVLVMIVLQIPRRAAFAMSRDAFAALVPGAPVREYDGEALNQRVGMFLVKDYAGDPRGGVYFRVHAGLDGIGPNEMSYGFAFRPNPQGTPYGAKDYQYNHLGSEWYVFQASDDWY